MSVKPWVILFLFVLSLPVFGANKEVGILQMTQGRVHVNSVNALQSARLYEKDMITTLDANSKAQIYFLNGSSLILAPKTTIVIGEGNSVEKLNLVVNTGEIWADIKANVSTTFKGPSGTISSPVQGANSTFRLALASGKTELQVQKGVASLVPLKGPATIVKSGKLAVSDQKGTTIANSKSYPAATIESKPVAIPASNSKKIRHQICTRETNDCFSVEILFKKKS